MPIYTQLKYNSRTSSAKKTFYSCHFFYHSHLQILRLGREGETDGQKGSMEGRIERVMFVLSRSLTRQPGRHASYIIKIFTVSSFQFKHSSISEAIIHVAFARLDLSAFNYLQQVVYYMQASVCNQYIASSDWLIRGYHSPILPMGCLQKDIH